MTLVREEEYVKLKNNRNKINISAYFLLPLLKLNIVKNTPNFINSYLGVKIDNEILGLKDGYIYLIFSEEYPELINSKYFNKLYLQNSCYIYEFILSNKFINDYYNFIDGKYSEYSPEAKVIICESRSKEQKLPINKTDAFEIFTKSPKRIKFIEDLIGEKLPLNAEVMSKIDINKEIYEQ